MSYNTQMAEREKKFTVAWDCDGVLLDSQEPVLFCAKKELSRILGRDIEIEKSDLTSWNALHDRVLNLTGDPKIADEINNYWFTPDILRRSPPNLAAIEVFRRCQEIPDVVQRIITTRTPVCRQCTQDSLESVLPNFDWRNHFHIRSNSCRLGGDEFKIQQLKLHRVRFMNEDNPSTVLLIQSRLPNCRINYFNQPWNSFDNDQSRNLFRVDHHNPDMIFDRILGAREIFLMK